MSSLQFDPVESNTVLPAAVDVVVIGGGIVGTSTALALAERGVSVALCEKGIIGGEQSGRNWGWVRQMGRDPSEIPLAMDSAEIWNGLNARVGGETGYRRTGILYVCTTEREVDEHEAWLNRAREFQLPSQLLSRAELLDLLPNVAPGIRAGLHTATDGRAEPSKAAAAVAHGAQQRGALIFSNTAVRGIETSAGRVSGVVTERGAIRTQAVVLAGGAWSRLFAGNLGIDFPQLKILGTARHH
jgi:glycine/D-amino acid oxidase-like deaminating enzyme